MTPPETLPVRWSPTARENLVAIRAYIGEFAPLAAQRFAARLVATIDSLDQHPRRGRLVGGGVRELVVIAPYVVRYRVTADSVQILRIRHGSQLR